VLPLDADDKLDSTMLGRAVALMEQRPTIGIIHPHIKHFGSRQDVWKTGPFSVEAMTRDNVLPYCSLYRRKLFDAVGGYREDMRQGYEDWDFWLSALERGWKAEALPEPLFLYRKRPDSMLSDANKKRELLLARIV